MEWTVVKWNEENYGLLKKELAALAEPSYREFHQKLITGNSAVLGVRMPALRRLAKEIAKGDAEALFPLLDENSYEEMMIYGLILGSAKLEFPRLLTNLAVFLPKIRNWAVCDCTVAGLKAVKKQRRDFFAFLQPYLNGAHEYEVRFAVVALMHYYTDPPWIDEVLTLYAGVSHPGYYVKMAVAWALAEAYAKEPAAVEALLAKGALDRITQNKAIQKIRESYRVSAENKEKVTEYRL